MDFPKPPTVNDKSDTSAALTENESAIILDSTLSQKRRNDPTVLAFIDSFIRCKNIAQASADVGIKPSLGYAIRHYVDVSNAITRLIDRSAIKYGFDASEIMERTKEIVDFDPISVQNPDGTFIENLYEMSPEARRNIKKMKVKNLWHDDEDMNGVKRKIIVGKVIEYEFYDKMKAIDLAGKEKDMFKTTTRVEHDVTKDMASILLASKERAERAITNMRIVDAEVVRNESDEQ